MRVVKFGVVIGHDGKGKETVIKGSPVKAESLRLKALNL